MFFTQEDYRKIEKWLLANSVKDTEFAGAATPLKGNETVVLVQDGKNVKTSVKDIVDQFFLLGVSDFLNITDKYGESYISIDQAIQLIPAKARKEGQVITFLNTDGNWEIYQFIGKLNQWNNPTLWNNPLDWEKFIIDSILPDEEDLTKSLPDENGNSYLSLKDREYNPEDFSGLGRVILRKNIVEIDDPIYGRVTKNILFQDMIAQSNTIYEIRYDFDLNGNEIIIPARCTLDFQGGKIVGNGKVVFSNTKFDGILKLSDGFADSIVLEGTYEEGQVLMVEDRLKYWKDNKWNNVADDTNFTVKSTETLPAGQPAEVILTTVEDVTAFSFKIPRGLTGERGAPGINGDSVEYIFKLTSDAIPPERPTSIEQTTDFIPVGWTDNPVGVSAINNYEWVSVRKFRDDLWGEFSNPALWAKYGDNGQTGNSARTMYCKTASASNVPKVNANDINPGSIWGVTIPSYSGTEVIWGIQAIVAYDNTLVQNWQGPYLITGVNGKDGTPPNYKTYVFKLSDSKPSAPTSNDPDTPGGGWVDYPNQEGNWWQCVGTVNGVTGLVTEWGEVIPLNGRDGTAQDGKFTEFRFAKSSSDSAPSVVKSDRNPSGWTTSFPTISNTEILWMIKAVINPNNTLYSNWEGPIRISGEKGPQGNTGPAGKDGVNGSQGVSGIPGVDIELRYSLGTDTTYDATWNDTVKTTRNPTSYGWSLQMPTPTDSKLYIWLIQARIAHQVNGDAGTLETGSWSTPIKLNGTNGLPGPQGKKGQIVYPAGVYGNTVSYTTTETKAPYVYDPSDGNFYVLNAIMTWLGTEQSNKTPSQDFITNSGEYWLKFDAFEAIYAKIGIIANGLIGSVVFNGDYMFSQNGITSDGRDSTSYELFDPTNPSGGVFIPNICLNFKKGEGWLGNLNFSSRAGILSGQTLTLTKDRWAIDDPNLQYDNHDISADAMGIYFGGELTQGGSSAIGLHATLGRTSKFTIISRHWLLATDTDMLDKLPIGTVYLDESDHTLKVKY